MLLVLPCVAVLASAQRTKARSASVEQAFEAARWVEDEVGIGVTWKRAHFDVLFGAPQSLCVLHVERPGRERHLRFLAPEPFATVSTLEQATPAGAVAAVNGGFFDVSTGTPFGLLIQNGELRLEQDAERTVAIGVDRRERVHIEDRPPGTWKGMRHARGSWPLILRKGKPVRPGGWGVRDKRHPRTAVGLTSKRAVVLVTVDGRNERAAGMTLLELATTMRALGCQTAMNLDGGGSTTMWLRGRGIVNYPCDNQRFDHGGARAVADVLCVHAPFVIRVDEDGGAFAPVDAWRAGTHEKCVGGDYVTCTATMGADVRATFSVRVASATRVAVEWRWPRVKNAVTRVVCECELGELRDSNPRFTPNTWARLGELPLPIGRTDFTLRPVGEGEFAVDALRIVQVRE